MVDGDALYSSQPREESYDAIVVGSGFGGISCAAFLSKAGKKVLVAERMDGPGGYGHAFQRGPYRFDPAVHAVGQYQPGAYIDTWFRALGVQDRVTMIPLDPFYTLVLPDFRLTVPFGVEEFIASHAELFPHEEQALRDFMAVCSRVKSEWDHVRPGMTLAEFEQAAIENFPTVLRYRSSTAGQVMDEYLKDPRLKTVVGALWSYQGVPPSRVGFITFAGMIISLLEGGQSYCQGSFQNLVNAWVAVIEENGSELVVRNKVDRILIKDGQVAGVRLAGGQEVQAPLVISNADALQTFEDLVGTELFPENYMRRVRRMTFSSSAFLVYTATTLDLHQFDLAHEIFKYNSWDYDEVFDNTGKGRVASVAITVPTLIDPSLAPPGEHIVAAVCLMAYDIGEPWPEAKERYTEALLNEIEEVFPGFRSQLTVVEGSTPLAMERYSLNHHGAMYGWENTPHQTMSRRLGNKTPVEGLYLSSAWAQPGSGTISAMYSGFQTAQIIMGYADRDEFLRSLNPLVV